MDGVLVLAGCPSGIGFGYNLELSQDLAIWIFKLHALNPCFSPWPLKPFYDQLSVSFKDPKQHVVHVDGLLCVSSVRDLVTMLKMEISRGCVGFRHECRAWKIT